MIWFCAQILKTVFLVAAVLAYVEIGPGGDLVWSMINSTKELMLSVDYADWWNATLTNLKDFTSTVIQGGDHD